MKKNYQVHSSAASVNKIAYEKTKVYVRNNIQQIDNGWKYDEIVYTYPEFELVKPQYESIESLESQVNTLANSLEANEQKSFSFNGSGTGSNNMLSYSNSWAILDTTKKIKTVSLTVIKNGVPQMATYTKTGAYTQEIGFLASVIITDTSISITSNDLENGDTLYVAGTALYQ